MKYVYTTVDNRFGCHPDYPSTFLSVKIADYALEQCYEEFSDRDISNKRVNLNKLLLYADEVKSSI